MRLSESEAWQRVETADHGILGTVHRERGIDLVPVVYAIDDDHTILIPIDTVKEKTTVKLQRLENLANDPRCTMLVEHYDDDWSRLWWVRVLGHGEEARPADLDRFRGPLAERYAQYTDLSTVLGGIVLRPDSITGWAAV